MKIRPARAKVFHVDGRTNGRTDEQTWRSHDPLFAIFRTRLKIIIYNRLHSAGSSLWEKNHSCYTVGINCHYRSIYCTQWGESNPRVHIAFNLLPALNFTFPTQQHPRPPQVVYFPQAFRPKFQNFLTPRFARHILCPHTYTVIPRLTSDPANEFFG